jgi:hypothetical protein
VLGGGSLPVQEWVDFLSEDYLADYLPAGGAAVKVAVAGSADAADRLATGLRRASAQADCTFVNVSAEDTKVHLVEQLFFAVARQLDWEAVAASVVRAAYDASAFPATTSLLVSDVAAAYDVDARELYRSVMSIQPSTQLSSVGCVVRRPPWRRCARRSSTAGSGDTMRGRCCCRWRG